MSTTVVGAQPEKLRTGLKSARIVTTDTPREPAGEPAELVAAGAQGGVPYGVERVRVRARNIAVYNNGDAMTIAWCNSHSYEAVGSTMSGGDRSKPYPQDVCHSLACKRPAKGLYATVEFDVSINGALDVVFQRFHRQAPKPEELAPV